MDERIKNIQDSRSKEAIQDKKVKAPPNSRQPSNAFSFRMNKKEYGSPKVGQKRNRFDIDQQDDNLSEDESSSIKKNSQESPNFKSRKLDDNEEQQMAVTGNTTKDRVKMMSN